MKKKIIISSSDSKYFNLLKELFYSVNKFNLLNEYDFGILDTGLTEEQKTFFKDNNAIVIPAKWDVEISKYKVRSRDHLKTQFAMFDFTCLPWAGDAMNFAIRRLALAAGDRCISIWRQVACTCCFHAHSLDSTSFLPQVRIDVGCVARYSR